MKLYQYQIERAWNADRINMWNKTEYKSWTKLQRATDNKDLSLSDAVG